MLDTAGMLRIVFVCLGNRCRSPMAEGFVRDFAKGLPVEVGSVGLLDAGPVGAPREVLEIMEGWGVDLSSHRARALASVDLSGADLVIGFERTHLAASVVDAGVPHERAFTLAEIVRLLEAIEPPASTDPIERARLAVARAHGYRDVAGFVANEDIADPFGGHRRRYVDVAARTRDLSRRLLAGLFGPIALAGTSHGERRV